MDLENIKAGFRAEFVDLLRQYWSEIAQTLGQRHYLTLADCLGDPNRLPNCEFINTTLPGRHITMLAELLSDRYWHAVNDWAKIKDGLPPEKRDSYVHYMLARALEPETTLTLPFCWLVEQYANGNFSSYISQEELADYVNRGFWEYAHRFFDNPTNTGILVSSGIYEYLLRHFTYIDFSRYQEQAFVSLMWSKRNWISPEYITKVKEAEGKTSTACMSRLIHPIVDQAIRICFGEYYFFEREEAITRFNGDLKPYARHLGNETIQNLFKYYIRYWLSHIDSLDFQQRDAIDIVAGYVEWPDEEKKTYFSDCLSFLDSDLSDNSGQWVHKLVELNLPPTWFAATTQAMVNRQIANCILHPFHNRDEKDIIPHIGLLNGFYRLKWIDGEEVKTAIQSKITGYLDCARTPKAEDIKPLIWLDPRLVAPDLYSRLMNKAIKDLRTRRQNKLADEWEEKLRSLEHPA